MRRADGRVRGWRVSGGSKTYVAPFWVSVSSLSFYRLCGHAEWCIARQGGSQLMATKPRFGAEETNQGIPRAGRVAILPVFLPEAQERSLREQAGLYDARSSEELADPPSHLVAQASVLEFR